MQTRYRSEIIEQLRDQQAKYAPHSKKLEQIENAEQLLGEIDPDRTYTYEYLCYRITGYRPDSSPKFNAKGQDVISDLRLFIEDVSDSADLRAEDMPEPVRTVEQLGRMFNVSTKTISRWRQQGLVSRRFLFSGRKRVGFLQSSVDRFVARNRDKVQRGAQFSQLTDLERDEIIYRARRMAQDGGCPSDITKRIAERMNRSVETIRYTLKQFDQENKAIAIFPGHDGPLGDEAKKEIYRHYRRGSSLESLAKRHCRTKSNIYRIVNEVRAARIMELPLDFIPNEAFTNKGVEKDILGPMPEADKPFRKVRVPTGLPPYLAALYDVPLLNREQEQHLFRKMNFLKYSAVQLREELDLQRPKASVMDEIEQLYEETVKVKNQIVQANLRLVVSIAKRHLNPSENFFELVSDGNISLFRAAEKFDYSRGNKFSTYASWAIMKNFAPRTIPGEFRHRDRFRTSLEEPFAAAEDSSSNPFLAERQQQQRQAEIEKILEGLDDREQKIIISRFGLDHREEPQTLKEVGEKLGVTKERIRQIEARALSKLRAAARDAKIEL